MNRIFSIVLIIYLFSFPAKAGNVQIQNVQQYDGILEFDISWQNSWRTNSEPFNHDAVWIFVKSRKANSAWKHQDLEQANVSSNYSQLGIRISPDQKGALIARIPDGSGTISWSHIVLEMDINSLDWGFYTFAVHAIEMVYVPEGAFYLGDGASVASLGDSQNQPVLIDEETTELTLFALEGEEPASYLLPANYPKGVNGFYCMKYEISQEQYACFLNTLTFAQQQARVTVSPDSPEGTLVSSFGAPNRNGIVIAEPGNANKPAVFACNANGNSIYNEYDDGQNRAMNYLSWPDLAAYLCWAALRPLTEPEFEKTCRGSNQPSVAGEFAWSTPFVIDANTLLYDATPFEIVVESPSIGGGYGLANHGYEGVQGPLRCGFAEFTGADDRVASGAAYYGVMEMSGNVWELCVAVNIQGALFVGSHGNGSLDAAGSSLAAWPDANGIIYRGGGWFSGIGGVGQYRDLAVSDRFYYNLPPDTRRNTSGGRGGRSAW